jgi:hypothetical protein
LKYVVDHSQDSLFEIHRSNIYTGGVNSNTDNCRDVYTCRFSEYVPNIQYRPGVGDKTHILRDAKWIYRATLPEKNIAIEATIILVNNYDGDTVTSQDWSIEVKRHILSNVQPINADYNRAEVGDVVARNTAGEKVIVRKADISSMDTAELTPIGVVAIPSSHNIYGNGDAMAVGFIRNGTAHANAGAELDFSELEAGLKGITAYSVPSQVLYPTRSNGEKNPDYFEEGQAYSDFDGYSNTYKICDMVFPEMWKSFTEEEVALYDGKPGYNFLKAFSDLRYIPSLGEVGYIQAYYSVLSETVDVLRTRYGSDITLEFPIDGDPLLTSSRVSTGDAVLFKITLDTIAMGMVYPIIDGDVADAWPVFRI